MRALLLGVCLLAAACGQNTAKAPEAEGDAAAPAFELPIQYQPFQNASGTAQPRLPGCSVADDFSRELGDPLLRELELRLVCADLSHDQESIVA